MKIQDFISYIDKERGFSDETISAYSRDLIRFRAYMEEVYDSQDPRDISSEIIRSWMVSLREEGLNPRSINRMFSSLRSYLRYMLKIGQIETNPSLSIQQFKLPKRLPTFVQKKELLRIINSEVEDDFFARQDRLILELFYATGMRKSELSNLREKDIDLGQNTIRVFGKRRKERIIPIHGSLREKIEKHILEKKELNNNSGSLFISRKGKEISGNSVYHAIKRQLRVANAEKTSPHVLRHSFATHLLDEGADIMDIKELLGHTDLRATQVYTHNSLEKLKRVYKQTHPRNK